MQFTHLSNNDGLSHFSSTEFDSFFDRSVQVSRALSRLTSEVVVPDTFPIDPDRPTLIAANHSSLFDLAAALILLGKFGMHTRIGVNSRFFKNPVGGPVFRRLGCIGFSRDDREAAENAMVDALLAGQPCAIMPEGKIVKEKDWTNGVGPGRPGISRIARRADAVVVPVGFAQSNVAWPPGKPLPKIRNSRFPIVATIGDPLVFDTDDHDANAATVMAAIADCANAGRT